MPATLKDNFKLVELGGDAFALLRCEDDSVYSGYGVNQAFVILEDSVLAFDAGFTFLQAKSLDNTIRRFTDKKLCYLVDSHHHSDHIFGNSYFYNKYSDRGLRIISHSNCASDLKLNGARRLKSYMSVENLRMYLSTLRIQVPNLTYKLDLHIEIEGTDFVFVHPESGAHTLGDTLLAMPSKGVIFAGDVLFNSYFPNLQDANLESWIDFLNDIDFVSYRKFVPGHGDICNQGEVVGFTKYLQKVRDLLLNRAGTDDESIRRCFELEGTHNWKFRSAIDTNVKTLSGKFKRSNTQKSQIAFRGKSR